MLPSCTFSSTCVTLGILRRTHPEGEPCIIPGITMCQCVFLAHRHFFLFRPRVVSRAIGSIARREPAGPPRRRCGPWPTPVARALGVQNSNSPRGGITSTLSHPGPCKPTYRLKECPTAHVISGILNVINIFRHY